MTKIVASRGGKAEATVLAAAAPHTAEQVVISGRFTLAFLGTFTGLSATLEVSVDEGAQWITVTNDDLTPLAITGVCRMIFDEPEDIAMYRVKIATLASGSVTWRFGK